MSAARTSIVIAAFACLVLLATSALAGGHDHGSKNFGKYEWTEINEDAEWAPRAGLQVLRHRGQFYLMGGRTPRPPSFPPIPGDSDIWGDVWKSKDKGASWTRILETDDSGHWPARAYFRALKKGRYMYVLGGQNFKLIPNPDVNGPPFISVSDFFNDCWRSRDGIRWRKMTENAGWEGRAGLSAVTFKGHLWVMGGSFNDDPAVIGGPPTRVYFNDVWKSRDGRKWKKVTGAAPWAPRAGAVVAVKNGYMYLFGGEDGFICLPGGRCPPYYNDVWRSRDGKHWELVTAEAEWPARPGHQVVVLENRFILFGGFGLSTDPDHPFAAANPMDMWASKNGAHWVQFSDSPWNATTPEEIKYDFAALVAPASGSNGSRDDTGAGKKAGNDAPAYSHWGDDDGYDRDDDDDGWQRRMSIYTFGGDRETFNFMDPTNYLNVDNDVWEFYLPGDNSHWWWSVEMPAGDARTSEKAPNTTQLHANMPNPFNPTTTISFDLAEPGLVSLEVYDVAGRLVRTLVDNEMSADRHSFVWDGKNGQGVPVTSGVYFYRLTAGEFSQVRKMVLLK